MAGLTLHAKNTGHNTHLENTDSFASIQNKTKRIITEAIAIDKASTI